MQRDNPNLSQRSILAGLPYASGWKARWKALSLLVPGDDAVSTATCDLLRCGRWVHLGSKLTKRKAAPPMWSSLLSEGGAARFGQYSARSFATCHSSAFKRVSFTSIGFHLQGTSLVSPLASGESVAQSKSTRPRKPPPPPKKKKRRKKIHIRTLTIL